MYDCIVRELENRIHLDIHLLLDIICIYLISYYIYLLLSFDITA